MCFTKEKPNQTKTNLTEQFTVHRLQKACQISLSRYISLRDTLPEWVVGSHCDYITNLSPSSTEARLATGTELGNKKYFDKLCRSHY